MSSRDDDLYAPTLGRVEPLEEGERPWRLNSQLWVGFFGGALAVTAIALLNGRRLGLERGRLGAIAGIGLAALVGGLVVSAAFNLSGGLFRIDSRATGVVAYLGQSALQRVGNRHYQVYRARNDEDYDSLWGPGLAAVFGLGLLQVGLTALVVHAI